jgi:hypothetical protein
MSSRKRIFRRVVSADPIHQRFNLGLECGHRLEWATLAKRKACRFCEYIADFAQRRPGDYKTLVRLLRKIPMDDRANVTVEWIRQIDNALVLMKRGVDGVDSCYSLLLEEEPGSYHLSKYLAEDDDDYEAIGSKW